AAGPPLFPYTTLFRSGDEFEIVLDALDRRHEHTQAPIARLDRNRGAHGAAQVADFLFDDALLRARSGKGGHRLRRLFRLGQRARSEEHTSELQSRENL